MVCCFKSPTDLSLHGFADADWALDPNDCKFTYTWDSKKQAIISRSNTETEYRGLALAAAELIWLKSLFSNLSISLPQTLFYGVITLLVRFT